MFCPHCGAELRRQTRFCGECGHTTFAVDAGVNTASSAPRKEAGGQRIHRGSSTLLPAAGFVIGGLVGFLMRPAALIIGQLPFETVVTRGSMLSGLDVLLVPTAQASFNVMAIGAILGAVSGFVVSYIIANRYRT
jgi:hypothetical protein